MGASGSLDVFVTVGMGPFPFDRLIKALNSVDRRHAIFAQVGCSHVTPGCPHQRYLGVDEFWSRLGSADVIVTHAGNTVRLAQSLGKIPIAVAREKRYGEMSNDHQVTYLRAEERASRVVALRDVSLLGQAIADHPFVARQLLAGRPLPEAVPAPDVVSRLDDVVRPLVSERAGRRRRGVR